MDKQEKYLSLLKAVYLAYLRFDKALNAEKKDSQEINIAYTWLDTCMSRIFDEIGDYFAQEGRKDNARQNTGAD